MKKRTVSLLLALVMVLGLLPLSAFAAPGDQARLASLLVHTTTSPKDGNVLLKNPEDSYTGAVVFDPDTLSYTLAAQLDTVNQLRFRPVPENEGDKVTLYYGGDQSKDVTWTSGSSKWANCLSAGRNELKLVVTGEGRESVTYTLIVDCAPTLSTLSVEPNAGRVYWNAKFSGSVSDYVLTVPANATALTLNAVPKASEGVTLTYNGAASNVVDITATDKIQVTLKAGEVENSYSLTLQKSPVKTVAIKTSPADALVSVYDSEGNTLAPNADGTFTGMFAGQEYTYVVTKYGYVAQTGSISADADEVQVTLEKAPEGTAQNVDAYWPNFRGNQNNMAITDVLMPIDPAVTGLKWNQKLGTGWANAPSVQIIVDNALIVMVNKGIYKLDLQTGEVLAQGEMVAAPNFGYTPPAYAEGLIFCPLGSGTIQAFDAKTLQSVWIYRDPLKGQSLSPITYSDGYIYTGFWNGESREANFVCLSVTDEDPSKTDEAKLATWKHTQLGGFYWAGALVLGDAVIVGTDDGANGTSGNSKLYSFQKTTGKILSCLILEGAGDQRSSIAYDAQTGRIFFTTKGGYLCRADVAADGTLSGLKTFNNLAQSTSTPLVYKGKVYYGTGSGISTTGSSGNVVVADAESLEMLYAVGLKGYPQCSLLMTTGYEASTGYLYLYSTYNNQPGGISMIKIDPNDTTGEKAELVELYDAEGFAQYCITSPICGPDGTIYYKNDSGNVLAISAPQENAVMTLIDAIGTVTLDSEAKIAAARAAYDALTEEQKANVSNYATLTKAEETLAALKQEAADKTAVQEAEALIEAIGTVTLDSEAKITAARAAYDALTDGLKAQVSNYAALTEAEKTLTALKQEAADQAAAKEVEALIQAIGKVTKDSEKAIAAARTAYDALTEAQKKLVANYETLTAAEAALKALEKEEQKPAVPGGNSPQTGDATPIALFVGTMTLSLLGLLVLMHPSVRKRLKMI